MKGRGRNEKMSSFSVGSFKINKPFKPLKNYLTSSPWSSYNKILALKNSRGEHPERIAKGILQKDGIAKGEQTDSKPQTDTKRIASEGQIFWREIQLDFSPTIALCVHCLFQL